MPFWRGIVGAEAFGVEGDLSGAGDSADGVVEVALAGFRFAFDLPDAGVGEIVGLFHEGRDEGWAKPLNAIVRLSGKVSIV